MHTLPGHDKVQTARTGGRMSASGRFCFAPAGGPVPAAGLFFPEAERMDYKESDPFYHRKEWKRIREMALQRDGGMCRDCMDRMRSETGFRPRRATLVHPIIPRSERPDLELTLENLISLCPDCHEKRHPEKRSKVKRKTVERAGRHSMRVIRV